MRRAQFYLGKKNLKSSLESIHEAIGICNEWGKEYCHDQVLLDTIVVRNRLSRVLRQIQDDILHLLTSVMFGKDKVSAKGDSDRQ